MKQNAICCDYCSEEIQSIDSLALCKSVGIHFRKYHTTCYSKAAAENRIRLSKPINFISSVVSLLVLSLIILAFVVFSSEKRLVFMGIFAASVIFIDIPYYLMWKNVIKPLYDQSMQDK